MGMELGFGSLKRAEGGFFVVCGFPLKRGPLRRLMRLAQRDGPLSRCLSITEYMLVKLVVKVTDRVRSFILARALAPIVKKLLEAIKGFPSYMRYVLGRVRFWMLVRGWREAEEVSRLARSWGNREAHKWAKDEGFAKYLTIINMPFWEDEYRRQMLQSVAPKIHA